MKSIGSAHPTEGVSQPCDTKITILAAGSSGQAADWPTSAQMVRLTGMSTVGVSINFFADLSSTRAGIPTTGQTTQGTTGFAQTVMGQGTYQIPGGSTGFSVAAFSSGYITAEVWRI